MPGFWLLAFMLGCIDIASYAAGYEFDGNWVGKGYTSGDAECPSFDVYMSIAGHHVEARLRDTGYEHDIELSFDLSDSGKFSDSFATESGYRVRITGSIKGERFQGDLRHTVCRGTWYAERAQDKTPAPATVATQTKLEPTATAAPSLDAPSLDAPRLTEQ